MYKYNSKDVLKIFRGGSTIYDVCNEVVPKLFNNNEIGYWYDPDDLDSTKLKWRRNLFTETEFRNGITDLPIKGGSFSFVPFAGLTQGTGVQIDMNAGGTYVYKTYAHKAGVIYNFSAYIRMQDGSAPVLGQTGSGADVDVCVVIKGNTAAPSITTLTNLGGGLYRVSVLINSVAPALYFGFVKYATNSNKPVIVSGYQLEESSESSAYQPITDFHSDFLNAFPKHTLFQDSSGTIPTVSSFQPVGLILDKSKNLLIGPERFIESDITITGESQKIDNTTYRIYSSAGVASGVQLTNKLPAGRMYVVEFTIVSIATVGDGIAAESIGGTTLPHKTIGRKRVIITPLTTTFFLKRSGICDYIVKDISVKEISGNHAYQSSSSSRPTLKQSPILVAELAVNGTFDTNVNGWSTYLCNLTLNNNAGLLTSTGTGNPQISQPASPFAGKTVYVSANFKNLTGGSSAKITLYHNTTGDIGLSIASGVTSGTLGFITQVPSNFGGNLICMFNGAVAGNSVEFDNISVREVVGYYSDCNYLEFDGIDDFLVTNNINFTSADKLSLFTGIRKMSDSAVTSVIELSNSWTSNNGTFVIHAPSIANTPNVYSGSHGTAAANILQSNIISDIPSQISMCLSSQHDISGDLSSLKVNNVNASPATSDKGDGTFGNFPLYIGRRGGVNLPFNGRIYSLIGVSRLTTASENSVIEKAIALKLGITL